MNLNPSKEPQLASPAVHASTLSAPRTSAVDAATTEPHMSETPSLPIEELLAPSKPCPFCGSKDLELNAWEEYVVCKNCDASAPAMRWQFRAHQWAKVQDELPTPGPVLIFGAEIGICTSTYTHKKFFSAGHEERPTHWHPMPPCPKH